MPAFGQTRLQIINHVLARLREPEAASSSANLYANLVARILNVVKTQIEQAWQWRDLRDTFTVTATPGTTSYALTSSGQFAQIIDMWNTTNNQEVQRGTTREFNARFFGEPTVATGDVAEYNPVGVNASYDVQFDVWPSPIRSNVLKVNVYMPEADPTADSTVVLVPNQVLIEGILAHMYMERGDDNGIAAQTQMDLYRNMLADAIASETSQDSSETDWYPI